MVRKPIEWLIDKLGWIGDKLGKGSMIGDALKFVPGAGPALDAAQSLLGRASGGPVRRGGAYVVGEHGPEVFRPSSDGTIVPNHELGGDIVIRFQPTLDGKVIADSTHRQAIRKKSTR